MNFYVYILYNLDHDKFYIGQTYNLKKRLFEHNTKLSLYTSKYSGRWSLVYYEKYNNRSTAMKRERFLKKQKNKNFYKKLCKTKKISWLESRGLGIYTEKVPGSPEASGLVRPQINHPD